MRFLRRLLGGSQTELDLTVTFSTRSRDNTTLDVVGEAYRQNRDISW
jgi:hypothetical protein